MSEWTAEKFSQRVLDVGLLAQEQLEAAWSEIGTRDASLDEFVGLLMRKQWLTNLQVDRLKKNERYGYFYGRYKVMYLVGAGSFARVYRAEHLDSGQVVAVKVLRNRFVLDSHAVQQFLDEARMVQQLRHVNIVPVFEVDTERDRPYMVMEFVEGQNLREFVKVRKKLEVSEALSLAEDVAAALDFAAGKGVKHRDLKLSNVLVTSSKRGKLVDFGLAAVEAATGDSKSSQRSIDYAGLERLTGVKKDDPRSDIYFAGCILYHLLTGEAPLSDTRDRSQRLNASRFREVQPITSLDASLPNAVVHLVNKSMELDPERRYQTPGEMLHDVKIVRRALSEGIADQIGDDLESANRTKMDREGENRSVMVVESNIELQDTLRDLLKRRGYRVLVIGNAQRALQRFEDDQQPADCVLFCTTEMGREAVEAFNHLGASPKTQSVPAVLLLDESHKDMAGMASVSTHRVLLELPLKVRQLRAILLKLLTEASSRDGKT